MFNEQPVVPTVSIRRITDDWVSHVVEVPADLVLAPGQRANHRQ